MLPSPSRRCTLWRVEVDREEDACKRGIIVGLALVFAELAGRREVWQRGVEGMNVERSQVVTEWEQRGEARGELRGERKLLLTVLRARLGKEVPEDVRAAVEAQDDPAKLTAWAEAVATASTVESIRAALGCSAT